ncbi:hypothetical protein [Hansschlegelia beijingensis]|uniref:Uncharacterized protein n=1 Tax=Hansschlegelia beijingensis TaxID=1133344 RepID=A0A7W6CXA2_9HYPH|nr:hypothetical protein [Hansschlegelia beijingensis]MBB3972820.1 hypothetical protein [Hansschlegelia beijingensis]
MTMTREDVIGVIGPADDVLVAEIVATGATPEELAEAWAWLNADEALLNEGRPLPAPRVAALAELLRPEEDEEA